MRGKNRLVLWPLYFDSGYTCRDGRRLPKNLALNNVGAEEIFQAASELALEPELQDNAAHPRFPWDRRGAVTVSKVGSKKDTITDLAGSMRRKRASK